MLTPSDLRFELNKIRLAVNTKNKATGQAVEPGPLIARLWTMVIDDIGKFGDQRSRTLIRLLNEFKP